MKLITFGTPEGSVIVTYLFIYCVCGVFNGYLKTE